MVAGLGGVEDFGQCCECVVGDGDGDGGLPVFLVPQDGQVEDFEQAGFEDGRQVGEDVAGVGDFIEDGGVGGLGLGMTEPSPAWRGLWVNRWRAEALGHGVCP